MYTFGYHIPRYSYTEITNRINAHYPIERMYREALAQVYVQAAEALDRIDAILDYSPIPPVDWLPGVGMRVQREGANPR